MQGPAGTAHDWEIYVEEWNRFVTHIQMVVLIGTSPKAHHNLKSYLGHPLHTTSNHYVTNELYMHQRLGSVAMMDPHNKYYSNRFWQWFKANWLLGPNDSEEFIFINIHITPGIWLSCLIKLILAWSKACIGPNQRSYYHYEQSKTKSSSALVTAFLFSDPTAKGLAQIIYWSGHLQRSMSAIGFVVVTGFKKRICGLGHYLNKYLKYLFRSQFFLLRFPMTDLLSSDAGYSKLSARVEADFPIDCISNSDSRCDSRL